MKNAVRLKLKGCVEAKILPLKAPDIGRVIINEMHPNYAAYLN
ncbi:MAG: hypothetical protein ACI9RO_000038 [Alteromonas macleodii]|jgi:hypothetical protein|tara:strand:+ start:503 stop:631 length:129 start_codon:yes stop_codon:yes gene_type:complete